MLQTKPDKHFDLSFLQQIEQAINNPQKWQFNPTRFFPADYHQAPFNQAQTQLLTDKINFYYDRTTDRIILHNSWEVQRFNTNIEVMPLSLINFCADLEVDAMQINSQENHTSDNYAYRLQLTNAVTPTDSITDQLKTLLQHQFNNWRSKLITEYIKVINRAQNIRLITDYPEDDDESQQLSHDIAVTVQLIRYREIPTKMWTFDQLVIPLMSYIYLGYYFDDLVMFEVDRDVIQPFADFLQNIAINKTAIQRVKQVFEQYCQTFPFNSFDGYRVYSREQFVKVVQQLLPAAVWHQLV